MVPVVLVDTTGRAQVIADDGTPLPTAAAAEVGVLWIDMTRKLRGREGRQVRYFIRDGDWAVTGHRAVTQALADRLEELGVLP